jgi:hypothetical protein
MTGVPQHMKLGVCGSKLKEDGFVDCNKVWFAGRMCGPPARPDDFIWYGAGIVLNLGTERGDAIRQDAEQMCLAIAGVTCQNNAASLSNVLTDNVIKAGYGVKTPEIVDRDIISKSSCSTIERTNEMALMIIWGGMVASQRSPACVESVDMPSQVMFRSKKLVKAEYHAYLRLTSVQARENIQYAH